MEVKHVRDLMEAYSSVYSQSEETLDENVQDAVKGALEAGAKFMKTNPVGKAVGAVIAPVGPGSGTVTGPQQKQKIQGNVKEDLFDIIKGHLLDEGYADTEEAATAIMANMSEEWKQSIVEQSAIGARAAKVVDDQRQGYHGDSDAINKLRDDLSRSMGRLRKGQGPVVTPGLPGV